MDQRIREAALGIGRLLLSILLLTAAMLLVTSVATGHSIWYLLAIH